MSEDTPKDAADQLLASLEAATPGPWQARFLHRLWRRVRESPGDLAFNTEPEQDWKDCEAIADAINLSPMILNELFARRKEADQFKVAEALHEAVLEQAVNRLLDAELLSARRYRANVDWGNTYADLSASRLAVMGNNSKLKGYIRRLEEALRQGSTWFHEYGVSHATKGDDEKARRNYDRAAALENVIKPGDPLTRDYGDGDDRPADGPRDPEALVDGDHPEAGRPDRCAGRDHDLHGGAAEAPVVPVDDKGALADGVLGVDDDHGAGLGDTKAS